MIEWIRTHPIGSQVCEKVTNFSMVYDRETVEYSGVPTWIWRHEFAASWLRNHSAAITASHRDIPILETHLAEANLFDTYATYAPHRSGKPGKPQMMDCTHHTYAPLHYDAILMRLARVIAGAHQP